MIQPGKYTAVAVAEDVQWGKTKTDKVQVAIPFRIEEGQHAGHTITWFGFFTEKARERTLESLRFCGWKGNDLANLGPLDQQVEIVVDEEEYDGKVRTKVQWVNRLGSGKVKLNETLDPNELRTFAAEMRGLAQGVAEVDGPKAQPGNGAGSHGSWRDDVPPPTDDDINF